MGSALEDRSLLRRMTSTATCSDTYLLTSRNDLVQFATTRASFLLNPASLHSSVAASFNYLAFAFLEQHFDKY